MKTIFNALSGSFFRTIGRILAYVAIGLVIAYFSGFINISNVKAATTLDYSTLNSSSYAHFVNCVSADNCANWFSYTNNIGGAVPFWTTSSGVLSSANGSGVGLNISVSEGFVSGNYYTVSVLVGTVEDDYKITGNTSNSYKVRTNSGSNAYIGAHGTNVTISTLDSITLQYVDNGSVLLNLCTNCSLISYTFQANQTGTYFFGTMTTATSSTNHWDYYGYYYSDHGSKAPTTSEISSALQSQFNSVTNSITNAQNSINNNINEMKDKQDQTNQELSDMSDYLTDDTPPEADLDSLGNVQGLLPAGPIDSLLNIPFMFLSVLTSSMSGTCVPLEGTFVFDSTLSIPCFGEMFYDEVPDLLLNFISLIPSAFILIGYFKHLYKKVDRAVSMDTTSDDEWGVL